MEGNEENEPLKVDSRLLVISRTIQQPLGEEGEIGRHISVRSPR